MPLTKPWTWAHCFAIDREGSPFIPMDGEQCRTIFPGALKRYWEQVDVAITRSFCLFGGLIAFDFQGQCWAWSEEAGRWTLLTADDESHQSKLT